MPNDTYDDHKVACVSSDSSPSHHRQEGLESMYPDGLIGDLSDGPREVADDEAGHSESGPVNSISWRFLKIPVWVIWKL